MKSIFHHFFFFGRWESNFTPFFEFLVIKILAFPVFWLFLCFLELSCCLFKTIFEAVIWKLYITVNLKCHVSSISFYMPFNILCFCFNSNVFAFLQISLFCWEYVLYLPSYILAFLQIFFSFLKTFVLFFSVFAFLQINLLSNKHFCFNSDVCFPANIFPFLHIFVLSFKSFWIPANNFLLSCKHSYFP